MREGGWGSVTMYIKATRGMVRGHKDRQLGDKDREQGPLGKKGGWFGKMRAVGVATGKKGKERGKRGGAGAVGPRVGTILCYIFSVRKVRVRGATGGGSGPTDEKRNAGAEGEKGEHHFWDSV